MKRKILIIAMLMTTTMSFIGCSDKEAKDDYKVLDSIILDDDVKRTNEQNTPLDIKMIAKTEGLLEEMYNWGSLIKDKIIYYTIKPEENNIESQFHKWCLDSLKVGDITNEIDKETGLNLIDWHSEYMVGWVIQDFSNSGEVRIVNNNKGYKFNSAGELEEIKAYEIFLSKYGDSYGSLETYMDGTIDLFWIERDGIKKIVIIDTVEDKYYEINGEAFSNISKESLNNNNDRRLAILGMDDNKIYVSLESTLYPTYSKGNYENSAIIGYIENDKFTKILSSDIGINVNILGGAIYSNGRILFSGYAEDRNGIWNYDINTKKLSRQVDVTDETVYRFNLNPTKDKIMMTGSNYAKDDYIYSMNLATINENLEISNLTNVLSTKTKGGIKSLAGWSDDGTEFYLYTTLPGKDDVVGGSSEVSYEIYRIGEFSVDIKSNKEVLVEFANDRPFIEFSPIIKGKASSNIQYHWIIDNPFNKVRGPFELFVNEEKGGSLEIVNSGEAVEFGVFAMVCYANLPEKSLPTYFNIILKVEDTESLEVLAEKIITIENRSGEYKVIKTQMTEEEKEDEVLNTLKRIVFNSLPEDIRSTLDDDFTKANIKTIILKNDSTEVLNERYLDEEVYGIEYKSKDNSMPANIIYTDKYTGEIVGYDLNNTGRY